jgi:hypothetical protein
MPHDNVVNEVLNSKADVGFVRTGILEDMQKEGKIKLSDFKIINKQLAFSYPVVISTAQYHEWAFASTAKTPETLGESVAKGDRSIEGNHNFTPQTFPPT